MVKKMGTKGPVLPPLSLMLSGALAFAIFMAFSFAIEIVFLRTAAVSIAETEAQFMGHHLGEKYFRPGILLDSDGNIVSKTVIPDTLREEMAVLEILLLKIYNSSGKIVASTDEKYVGMVKAENVNFQAALAGTSTGHLASKKYYRNLYGHEVQEDLLEIYVPILSPVGGSPVAVLEIYRPWHIYAPLVKYGLLRTTVGMAGVLFLFAITLIVLYHWAAKRIVAESSSRAKMEGALALAGATAHHLNQPLMVLTLQLEDLLREDEVHEEDYRLLKCEVDRISNTVRRISEITEFRTVPYIAGIEIVDLEDDKGTSPDSALDSIDSRQNRV